MKKIISLCLLLGFIPFVAFTQTKKEKAVAAAVLQLRSAMLDGNKQALETIADAQLGYGHSGGHVDSRQEFVEKLTNGSSDFVTMELSDQTIQVSGNTAIVRHVLAGKTNDNGKPGEVRLKVMLVWQKKDGSWKLLARQAVKLP